MSATRMMTVFCYDVESDRRRRRVSSVLEEWGVRVQKSVFEARLTAAEAEKVMRAAGRELGPGDQLRMYAVTGPGLTRSASIGGAPIGEDRAFYLL